MEPKRGSLVFPVNGESMTVPQASHLSCPSCGEVVLRLDEADSLREAALETYRRKHGLLTGAEIRAMRRRLGLTQAAMAKLLRLGSNTVSRWEAGRNVQSASMDMLLRVVRDLPGGLEYLQTVAA